MCEIQNILWKEYVSPPYIFFFYKKNYIRRGDNVNKKNYIRRGDNVDQKKLKRSGDDQNIYICIRRGDNVDKKKLCKEGKLKK
jgi:hypothetical protein